MVRNNETPPIILDRSLLPDDPVACARKILEMSIVELRITAPPDDQLLQYMGEKAEEAALNPDTNDFDVLVGLAADVLYKGEMFLPRWLAIFAADVLSGKRKRPTKKGADKYVNWERDFKLWRTTQAIAEVFNLSCYSNKELSEKTTAADIVAAAWGCKPDIVVNAYKKFTRMGG